MHASEQLPSPAPRSQMRSKIAPLSRAACLVHDIFGGRDSLAFNKLIEPRSYRSQRRWASCVRKSETARELLKDEVVTYGDARRNLAQKLNKDDASAVISVLRESGYDDNIVAFLKQKFGL